MRFSIGLLVGAVLGASLTWLLMARPWRGAPTPAVALAADAGAAAEKPTRKKGRRRGHGGRAGGSVEGDAEAAAAPPPPTLSAADRAMTWRGPAISLPPRSIDLASGDDARPLESGEINDVVARSSDPILACIEQARLGAILSGEVRLEMLVGGGGAATKIRVGGPRWLIEHGLADCATGAARRFRFPATGAPTIVDVPYHLD